MSRPMGAMRRQFLESCSAMGKASAHDVAMRTGLPRLAVQRVAGSDRPVAVYAPSQRCQGQPASDARAWFVDLGNLCR